LPVPNEDHVRVVEAARRQQLPIVAKPKRSHSPRIVPLVELAGLRTVRCIPHNNHRILANLPSSNQCPSWVDTKCGDVVCMAFNVTYVLPSEEALGV
jgi:hypothetical protein